MKKYVLILIFALLLMLCACQDVPDPSGDPSSSGQQLASRPSSYRKNDITSIKAPGFGHISPA